MRTLVISDLHLGAHTEVDVLRRAPALEVLCEALDGVERLVVLGDALELRHGPMRDALDAARPALQAIGAALGAHGEVVLVPGNHDYRLISPWLDWRSRAGHQALGLEERAGAKASTATRALARMLQPAALDIAYPGVWLRDDVYATHGHYLDRHLTVPTIERLAAGLVGRVMRAPADAAATPDDYERALAPVYALLDAIAARRVDGGSEAIANASARAWTALSRDGNRRLSERMLAGAFPLAIAVLNGVGLGPLRSELTGSELRRAGLAAMRQVVARLGIDARHVIFGHTHRVGPLAGDDASEWALAHDAQLHNPGAWVYESMYLDRAWGKSPYWPGAAIELDGDAAPRLLRLLEGRDAAELRPPGEPVPA